MQPTQPHEVDVKNLRLDRETESHRLERLKRVLQAKIAVSERKPLVGGIETSANR
jgi:hypothetical protein